MECGLLSNNSAHALQKQEGKPAGEVEAKKPELGEKITTVEEQSSRYANSTFKWVQQDCSSFLCYNTLNSETL